MTAVAVVTTPFFTTAIITERRSLLTTQVARLAARLVARWLERLRGVVGKVRNRSLTESIRVERQSP